MTTESNLKKTNVVKSKNYLTILLFLICAIAPQSHAQLEGILKSPTANGKSKDKPALAITEQLEIWKKQVSDDLARLSGLLKKSHCHRRSPKPISKAAGALWNAHSR